MRFFNRILNMRERELRRTLWITGAVLIVMAALFFGYYYVDRYVRIGNQSTADRHIQELEQAVRDNPQAPEPRVALAQLYLGNAMYAKAIDQATQVLTVYPEREDALFIAGMALTRASRTQEAIARFETLVKLLERDQKSSDIATMEATYYFLGQNYNMVGQHGKALTVLESALKLTPTDADALYQAGLASQATKQYEMAVGYYGRAVRLVPDFAEAYGGMIDSYTALNRLNYVAYARGMQAFSAADYKTAQTNLEKAIKELPDYAPAYYGLALTYEKLNRLQDAYSAIKNAVQLEPTNIAIQQAYGRLQNAVKAQQ